MKLKTMNAAKLSDERAYRSSVSEPVSDGISGPRLKSCCAAMMASRRATIPASSHAPVRRVRSLRCGSDWLAFVLTEDGRGSANVEAKFSTGLVGHWYGTASARKRALFSL